MEWTGHRQDAPVPESDDKKTSYDLDLPASGKMEGRFTGRLVTAASSSKRQ